jgi:adenylate cyclase
MWLPTGAALMAALVVGALYGVGSFFAFKVEGLWLPTMTPLLVQLPAALFATLLWNYRRLQLQREKMREALGHYVPERVVKRLAQESLGAKASAELLHGTCLFTDAEQYTAVAESLRPEELAEFMNDYYQVMFRVVERHEGVISDIAGDSMVAIWAAAEADSRSRARACRAALDVYAAVAAFNRTRGQHELRTHVGLESGEVFLGNVGAANRYEYRAVGGIVSTASRIQGLNRVLGTQILVSATTLTDAGDQMSRHVGAFRLRGKTTPSDLYELRDNPAEPQGRVAEFDELRESFALALDSFRQAHWTDAEQRFARLLQQFPGDGPTEYYWRLAVQYREQPPAQWDGVVTITAR